MIGAHKALNPILIEEYSNDFELLVIEIKIKNKEIRLISGYGPQECWNELERIPFFVALEKEIAKAELLGKSIIIEMDSNSKLGTEWIPADPHPQSPNGRLLAGVLERHGMVVVNGIIDKCVGVITRKRVTVDSTEESIIDHLIISEDLKNELESLLVDEERNHVLTKTRKTKNGVVKVKSDHNPLVSKFKMTWNKRVKSARIEMFNLKNKDCQQRFKELTNHGTFLSEVFDTSNDLNKSTDLFIKRLNKVIRKSFKKIRISDKPDKELEALYQQRNILKKKKDDKSKDDLLKIEIKLAEKCAEKNYNYIKEEISNIKVEEGGLHFGSLWRLKKKFSPKCRDPPTAMLDESGNLLTSYDAIEKVALKTFADRLKNRPMKENLKHVQKEKEDL